MKREEKIDIDKLSLKKLENLSLKLGKKIGKILDKASKEANKVANIYGLEVRVGYNIEPAHSETKE